MVNVIKQEVRMEEHLRKRLEFICEFCRVKPIIINGNLRTIDKTNLTYLDEDIKNKPWFEEVDCSENISEIIYKLYLGQSISPLLNGKAKATELVRSLRKKN